MVPPAALLVSPWSDPTGDAGKCLGKSSWDGEGLKNFTASAKCPGDLEPCLLSAGFCWSSLQRVVSLGPPVLILTCPLCPPMSATPSPPVLMPHFPVSNPYMVYHMYLSFPTSPNSESPVPSHQQNHALSASLPLSALTGSDLFLLCFLISSSGPFFLHPENTLVWILCHLTVFSIPLPCWGLYSKTRSPTGLVMSTVCLSSSVSVLICDDFNSHVDDPSRTPASLFLELLAFSDLSLPLTPATHCHGQTPDFSVLVTFWLPPSGLWLTPLCPNPQCSLGATVHWPITFLLSSCFPLLRSLLPSSPVEISWPVTAVTPLASLFTLSPSLKVWSSS